MPTARFKLFSTMTLVSLVVASLAFLPAASAAPGIITRVSVDVDGADTDGASAYPAISSADGRLLGECTAAIVSSACH